MAVKHESISGSYDKTVEDSSHQSKEKFSNPVNKPKDDLPKPHSTVNEPKDSSGSKDGY